MNGDGSPPSSWYDPPEPRHSDQSLISDECNCDQCHRWHIEERMVEENAKFPDYQCCIDQMEEWFKSKRRCRKHPRAYAEEPCAINNFTAYCEECDAKEA